MKLNVPVIAILRGVDGGFFKEIMPASFSAGLQVIEITMNTVRATEIVSENVGKVPPGHMLGMGTICCLEDAKKAVGAGAMFMVTPNFDEEVIEFGLSSNVPVISGALTPTEVYLAWRSGADMVKVFPCRAMGGADYIKDLRGPYDDIPLVAVGGVSLDSLFDYFKAGVSAVGVGASIFGSSALAEKNINKLTKNVKNYIDCCLKLL